MLPVRVSVRSHAVLCCFCVVLGFAAPPSAYPSLCGDNMRFCPEGVATYSIVSSGYFTVGLAASIRSEEAECNLGSYCPGDGSMYDCPAGRFGGSPGLNTSDCTDICDDGMLPFNCVLFVMLFNECL